MKIPVSTLFLLSVSMSWLALAHAEKDDRNRPIFFEAVNLRLDSVKQITKASGKVVMTKGSIVVRAENIEVREDPDGYYFATITGTHEAPPSFRQKREGVDEFVEGWGDLIEYDGRADTVKFVNNAVLRRLRGTTLADEISGGLIVYENLTDRFRAESSSDKAGATTLGGRVRMMLVPKQDALVAKALSPERSGLILPAAKVLESLPK